MGRFNANQIGRLRDKVANDEPLTKEELLGVLDGHESAVVELFRLREQRAADDERERVERGKRLRAALTSTERGKRLFRDNVWYRAAVPTLQWGEQEGCLAEVLEIVLGPLTEELQKRVEREAQRSADAPARELSSVRLDDTLRSAVLARAPNVLGMLDHLLQYADEHQSAKLRHCRMEIEALWRLATGTEDIHKPRARIT